MASESGCPIEMHKIEIAKCDDMYDPECKGGRKMPFLRAHYDSTTGQSPNLPREQVKFHLFQLFPFFQSYMIYKYLLINDERYH